MAEFMRDNAARMPRGLEILGAQKNPARVPFNPGGMRRRARWHLGDLN